MRPVRAKVHEKEKTIREVVLEAGGLLRGSSGPALESVLLRHRGVERAEASYMSETVNVGYDEDRIRENCPFLVQGVLFNALLCQGEKDLAQIARRLGENPSLHEGRAEKTADAINWKLWDEGHATYLDFDLITGQPIRVYAAAGYLPLYAGVPDENQARLMLESLKNTGFRLEDEGVMPVPSYGPYGYEFPPVQYWRGPVWINIDWLLMRGLERYGFNKQAQHLRHTIVDLVRNTGFHEYFHPIDGTGHGSDLFSWTAALFLDVLMDGRPLGGGLCGWSTVPGDDR